MKFYVYFVAAVIVCIFANYAHADIWVKGNTHAHTTLSDGDVSPEDAVKWYKDHGYQFLVLTDHYAVAPDEFFQNMSSSSFVAIPGSEMHLLSNLGKFAVHCNSIGKGITAPPKEYKEIDKSLLSLRKASIDAGAIFQINHPSFHVLDPNAVTKVPGPALIEVYNHGTINSQFGSLATAAFEQSWDEALTAGRTFYAVASDDTHHYRQSSDHSPGGGFIYVRVKNLTRNDILQSLRAGKFYASTGVQFESLSFDGQKITVKVKRQPKTTYTIKFIGSAGLVLSEVRGTTASYKIKGGKSESYVRVKVISSSNKYAWSQAFRKVSKR